MTATETTTFTLTKDHVKALKTADSVCFDHAPAPSGDWYAGVGVRAVKRGKSPWFTDTTVNVPAHSSVCIHGDGGSGQAKTARCFASRSSAKYDEEWQTVVSLLRAGDELELRWVGDGGDGGNGYVARSTVTERSESTSDAGLGMRLHHDYLYLHVRRNGKRKYSFLLTDSVCPNNSARMIRP